MRSVRAPGPPTRGYHGWLVAATTPPDGRRLMVGAIETTAIIGGTEHRLHELELAPGLASRDGVEVRLEAWMPHETNAIVLRWTRTDATGASAAPPPRSPARRSRPPPGR